MKTELRQHLEGQFLCLLWLWEVRGTLRRGQQRGILTLNPESSECREETPAGGALRRGTSSRHRPWALHPVPFPGL